MPHTRYMSTPKPKPPTSARGAMVNGRYTTSSAAATGQSNVGKYLLSSNDRTSKKRRRK